MVLKIAFSNLVKLKFGKNFLSFLISALRILVLSHLRIFFFNIIFDFEPNDFFNK